MAYRECHIGARECDAPDPLVDVIKLCALSAQKLFAGRCVVEQVMDFDGRADRMCSGHRLTNHAVICLDGRCSGATAGSEIQPGNRGHTRQCLAAKSQ